LHPRLAQWFRRAYGNFTHAQLLCVPAILERESILLTSPTGSGKTLAGFLGVFDYLLRKLDAGTLRRTVQCIYVSPLRALAYDIGKNIGAPIAGMGLEKSCWCTPAPAIRKHPSGRASAAAPRTCS
jgi:ATP-dependent Lhr-like helicase